MRKVIFISRCRGKAKSHTRETLDAYAPRIGDETWLTSISEETLQDVRRLLLESATRRTAVACYVVTKEKANEVRWIVGDRRQFGSNGLCPIKTSSHGHKALSYTNVFPLLRKATQIVRFAGYCHDLGKNTIDFKHVLGATPEQLKNLNKIRHELTSLVIMSQLSGQSNEDAYKKVDWSTHPLNTKPKSVLDVAFHTNGTHHRLPDYAPTTLQTTNHTKGPILEKPHTKWGKHIFERPEHAEAFETAKHAVLHDNAEIPDEQALGLFLYTRLSLMLADHYVSSKTLTPAPKPGTPIANSATQTRPSQDLALHNYEVGNQAVNALAHAVQLPVKLPGLDPEDLQEALKQSRGRYVWQNRFVQPLESIGAEDGAFILNLAATGEGKTRTNFRAWATMPTKKSRRLTSLLGLRNLTLQTGDAYKNELALPASHCATIIGSYPAKRLHEEDSQEVPIVFDGLSTPLPSVIAHELKDRPHFLSTPCVVCTTDYLAAAGDYERSNWLIPTLRLLSSDLILDEIDEYSIEDIPALARLILLAGAFGRRVILSSATLYPEIAVALAAAYRAGWRIHASLGFEGKAHLFMGHNDLSPNLTDLAEAETAIPAYCDRIAKRLVIPEHLKLEFLDCAKMDEAAIKHQIDVFHDRHAFTLEGKKISIGITLITQTAFAGELYQRLCQLPERDNEYTFLLLYHRRIPLFIRSTYESQLTEILTRKPDWEKRFASTKLGKKIIARPETSVRFILVSTPIISTGNDFEFDYAIIEPASTRGVLQPAGRVKRHTRTPVSTPNVAVLKTNWHGTFNRPGLEPTTHIHNGNWRDLDNVLTSLAGLKEDPTPRDLLATTPKSALTARERETIRDTTDVSINELLVDSANIALLSNNHCKEFPFRQGMDEGNFYYCPYDRVFKAFDPEKPENEHVVDTIISTNAGKTHPFNLEEIITLWETRQPTKNPDEARSFFVAPYPKSLQREAQGNPLLGVYPTYKENS